MRTKCPKCGYIQELAYCGTKTTCRRESCGHTYKVDGRETLDEGNGTYDDEFKTFRRKR